MKIHMRIVANAELELDEDSGNVSNVSIASTELYASEDCVSWVKLEGSELDQSMTENVKKIIGL